MTRRVFLAAPALAQSMSYTQQIDQWRREREAALKADDGYLTLAGLHWLEEDKPRSDIAPGHTFLLHKTVVSSNGKPLKPDTDLIHSGTRTFFVIERAGRFAIRVRDTDSPYRKQFTKLSWYPVKPDYRIQARFTPHANPKPVTIPTVIEGVSENMIAPGVAEFTLNNTPCRLEPVLSGARLFFIFRDPTAGKSTYPAGRFLYSDAPDTSGHIELDFNKAYTPPCAFNPYATCPLPPRHNHLAIPVEAGELNYEH